MFGQTHMHSFSSLEFKSDVSCVFMALVRSDMKSHYETNHNHFILFHTSGIFYNLKFVQNGGQNC